MFDVSLSLLCTNKAGTLSRIVRDMKIIGLQYSGHKIEKKGYNMVITISANGDLISTHDEIMNLFSQLPSVLKVQQLYIFKNGKEITDFETAVSESYIFVHEPLTPAVIMAAERRLSLILGPVAYYIVDMATKYDSAGEFFYHLAQELSDEDERHYFLSIIKK